MKPVTRRAVLLWIMAGLLVGDVAHAQAASPEYRVKAGFLYNFISFTEWPPKVGSPLPLCVYGENPFGTELEALEGKTVGGRSLTIRITRNLEELKGCRVVFVASSAIDSLPRILDTLQGEPVLTVADTADALDRGVEINMSIRQGKVAFAVNLAATRQAQLMLSSKLLRLASEVRQ